MTTLPAMPKGIEKDDASHGVIYYTRAQMRAYGQACIDAEIARIASEARHACGDSDVMRDLFGVIGGRK